MPVHAASVSSRGATVGLHIGFKPLPVSNDPNQAARRTCCIPSSMMRAAQGAGTVWCLMDGERQHPRVGNRCDCWCHLIKNVGAPGYGVTYWSPGLGVVLKEGSNYD